mgnify:CR=1 FL=1
METEQGTILVTVPMEERHRALLASMAPDAPFVFTTPKAATPEQVRSARILLGKVPPALLADAPRLEWMQLDSAGTDGYTGDVLPAGARLTNASGAYGLAIAEHMLAMALSLMKKLPDYTRNQARAQWHDEGAVASMFGLKVLVVGLGDIGTEFASRCHALGARVRGIRRVPRPAPDGVEAVVGLDRLDDELPEADLVALCLPATSETRRLFDAVRLARMKTGAILLNVGRGSVLDQEALCDALENGRLAGAGLDVTDPEPLPPDHRLWRAPRLILTPHVAGGWHLPETKERIVRLMADNLRRFFSGRPLRSLVDGKAGYRRVPAAADELPTQACLYRVMDAVELHRMVDLRMRFIRDVRPEMDEAARAAARIGAERYLAAHLAQDRFVFFEGTHAGETACFGALLLYDLPPLSGAEDRRVGHVLNFFTEPAHRHKGFGFGLMTFIQQYARERGFNRLSLHATEAGAPLYRLCGYQAAADAMEYFID